MPIIGEAEKGATSLSPQLKVQFDIRNPSQCVWYWPSTSHGSGELHFAHWGMPAAAA